MARNPDKRGADKRGLTVFAFHLRVCYYEAWDQQRRRTSPQVLCACCSSNDFLYWVYADNQIKVYSPDFAEQSLRELQESTTHRDITAVAAAWDRVCLSTTTCQRRDAAVPTMSTDRSVETGDGPTHELVVLDGVHSSDRLKWRITSCPVPFSCTSVSCSDASIITVAGE